MGKMIENQDNPGILTFEEIKQLGILQPNKTGVLTFSEIQELGIIHTNFNSKNLEPASYDLTLGNEFIYPSSLNKKKTGTEKLLDLFRPTNDLPIDKCDENRNHLKIPRFSSVIFSTAEILHIPDNVVGRFDLKIRYSLMGLVLQVGTQIEPNYKGILFGLLLNFSEEDIYIEKGAPFLTIEFSYLSASRNIPLVELEENIKNYNELTPIINHYKSSIKGGTLEAFFNENKALLKKNETLLDKVKMNNSRALTNIVGVIAIVITIFLGFIIYNLTKLTYDRDDHESFFHLHHPNTGEIKRHDRIQIVNEDIKQLNTDLESTNSYIESTSQELEDMQSMIKSISNDIDSLRNVISTLQNKTERE